MQTQILHQILDEQKDTTVVFRRNVVKEYLQILVLSFLYHDPQYQHLLFYGGSCLRHCFGLQRLSEDLDFITLRSVDLSALSSELKTFFKKELDCAPQIKIQKFRLYCKFPLLRELRLAGPSDSDLLYLKIELFSGFSFCKGYALETMPLSKYGKSFLVRTLDLPSLMATKLGAILERKWEKTAKGGVVLARVKGRDYFDLLWYLQQKIIPNLQCLGANFTRETLREKLLSIVRSVDEKSIAYDLDALIADRVFVSDLSRNMVSILERALQHAWRE